MSSNNKKAAGNMAAQYQQKAKTAATQAIQAKPNTGYANPSGTRNAFVKNFLMKYSKGKKG